MSLYIALGFEPSEVRDFLATLDCQRGTLLAIMNIEDLLPSSRRLAGKLSNDRLLVAHNDALRAGDIDTLEGRYYDLLMQQAEEHLAGLPILATNSYILTVGIPTWKWAQFNSPEHAIALRALRRRAMVICRVFNGVGGYTCETLDRLPRPR